jgi:hypothetical protein
MAVMVSFGAEASKMCMFLKYIKTIKLSIWHQGEDAPRLFSLVHAEDSDKAAAAKIPRLLSSPDVLDVIGESFKKGQLIESNYVKTVTHSKPGAEGGGGLTTTVDTYLCCNRLGTNTGNEACKLALASTVATDDLGAKARGKLRLLPLAGIAALMTRVCDGKPEVRHTLDTLSRLSAISTTPSRCTLSHLLDRCTPDHTLSMHACVVFFYLTLPASTTALR